MVFSPCHNLFLDYFSNSFFLFQNKNKKIYLEEIQKIIVVRRGCQSAQKIAKN
jgi:hypothetical protein